MLRPASGQGKLFEVEIQGADVQVVAGFFGAAIYHKPAGGDVRRPGEQHRQRGIPEIVGSRAGGCVVAGEHHHVSAWLTGADGDFKQGLGSGVGGGVFHFGQRGFGYLLGCGHVGGIGIDGKHDWLAFGEGGQLVLLYKFRRQPGGDEAIAVNDDGGGAFLDAKVVEDVFAKAHPAIHVFFGHELLDYRWVLVVDGDELDVAGGEGLGELVEVGISAMQGAHQVARIRGLRLCPSGRANRSLCRLARR